MPNIFSMRRVWAVSWAGVLLGAGAMTGAEGEAAGPGAIRFGAAERKADGLIRHAVESPFQSRATSLFVLLPEPLQPDRKYKVLYILPTQVGEGDRNGDPMAEVRKHNLHGKYSLICVYVVYSSPFWGGDHPTNPGIRQESHLVKAVVPFVEKTYPALARSDGRLLVGFSKSGWGVYCLLLRNPEMFGKAAAWDAPLSWPAIGPYGMKDVFGTPENFAGYHVSKLIEERAELLRRNVRPRLALLGYGRFRGEHQTLHRKMEEMKIPHEYRDGPSRKHHWESGWLPEAVEFLAREEGTAGLESGK